MPQLVIINGAYIEPAVNVFFAADANMAGTGKTAAPTLKSLVIATQINRYFGAANSSCHQLNSPPAGRLIELA